MKKIVGVDLGTTTACIVALSDDLSTVISDRRLPVEIAFTRSDRYYVSEDISSSALIDNPNRIILGFMRLLNDDLHDPRLVDFIEWMPYDLTTDDNDHLSLRLNAANLGADMTIPLTDVLTSFFKELAVKIGPRQHLALALPAAFREQQQAFVQETAKKAGLQIQSLCSAPNALASMYGRKHAITDRIVAFCDFGSGTFEVSIIYFGVDGAYQILSSCSDPVLGGYDFDLRVAKWILSQLAIDYPGRTWKDVPQVRARILAEAKMLKELLSDRAEAKVQLPFLFQKEDLKLLHFPEGHTLVLTREMLADLTRDLLVQIENVCRTAIDASPVDRYEIHSIVILGEQAMMPAFRDRVERVFGKPPTYQGNAKQWIAQGAALQAQRDDRKQLIYAPLNMRYGPEIVDVLRQTDRQQWRLVSNLLAFEPSYFACMAEQSQLFLSFVEAMRQIDMEEILSSAPDFSLLLYRYGVPTLLALSPTVRHALITQLYEAREELARIPERDLTAVIGAATQSSVRQILEIYREYGSLNPVTPYQNNRQSSVFSWFKDVFSG